MDIMVLFCNILSNMCHYVSQVRLNLESNPYVLEPSYRESGGRPVWFTLGYSSNLPRREILPFSAHL